MIRRSPCLLGMLVAAALCGGCGSSGLKTNLLAGTIGGWYAVSANQTAFYRYGPQQGNGPDEQLPRDTLLKVIRPSFGYVKVQLQTGGDGYVASEDIRPASAALVIEKLSPPPPEVPLVAAHDSHDSPNEEHFRLNSSDPRLIPPPEPLPEASPTPEFR
jgi:hypothetical protein